MLREPVPKSKIRLGQRGGKPAEQPKTVHNNAVSIGCCHGRYQRTFWTQIATAPSHVGRGLTILSVLANGAGNLEGPLTVDDAGEDFYRQLIHSREDSSIGKEFPKLAGMLAYRNCLLFPPCSPRSAPESESRPSRGVKRRLAISDRSRFQFACWGAFEKGDRLCFDALRYRLGKLFRDIHSTSRDMFSFMFTCTSGLWPRELWSTR